VKSGSAPLLNARPRRPWPTLNSDGQFTSVNNAMCSTGDSQKEMTDKLYPLVRSSPKKDVKIEREIVTQFTESVVKPKFIGANHPILHKDGARTMGVVQHSLDLMTEE